MRAFERLRGAGRGRVTPRLLLRLDDAQLKTIGFSRRQAGYARELARAVASGAMGLDALETPDDEAARAALIRPRGVGP